MSNKLVKYFHVEVLSGDFIFIGTDIRARSREGAEAVMKAMFAKKLENDAKFFIISEEIIH